MIVSLCDFIGAMLGITGAFFVIAKRRIGFLIWVCSNVFLITAFVLKDLPWTVVLFSVYTIINVIGFIAWSKKGKAWLDRLWQKIKNKVRNLLQCLSL